MTELSNGGPDLEDGPLQMRVIRIHINDWRASCRGLTCEEEGFFWRFNLMLYDRMGVLPDDDQLNCRSMGLDVRAYRRLKARLVTMGKITIEGARMSHPRVLREIESYVAEYKRRSVAAREREDRRRADEELRVADEIRRTLLEDQRKIAANSTGSRTEVQPISGQLTSELTDLLSQNLNEINVCDATTVPTADPRPSCARAFPKPKPKPISKDSPLSPPEGGSAIEQAFEEFWAAFPGGRKRAKGATRMLFAKIVTGRHRTVKAKAEDIIAAVVRYAASQPDPDYTPMPTTWLNDGRWEDDVGAAKAASGKPAWWVDEARVASVTPERWKEAIAKHANGTWPVDMLSPPPGAVGCRVPQAVIDELSLLEKYTPQGVKRGGHGH